MGRKHDWIYGECQRCGFSTDLAGVSNEDAPPCEAFDADAAERLVDAVGAALGVDTGNISEQRMAEALAAATAILEEM